MPQSRNLKAERLDAVQQHIEKLVAEAPPLTDAQRARLIVLLRVIKDSSA